LVSKGPSTELIIVIVFSLPCLNNNIWGTEVAKTFGLFDILEPPLSDFPPHVGKGLRWGMMTERKSKFSLHPSLKRRGKPVFFWPSDSRITIGKSGFRPMLEWIISR